MWKWLARRQLASNAIGRGPLAVEEIEAAESVLFAVFARYGDSVIAFKLIREFMQRHPGKRYRLVTTPQALPYAEAIIGTSWPMIGIDKRRHFLRLARWLRALRRERPALGLNPWSHGAESEYFIAQARRYCPYRDFAHFSRTENLYRRVRRYLQLPDPPPSRAIGLPAQAQRIVVSPFSTDVRKSLDHASLVALISWLQRRYPSATIHVALPPSQQTAAVKDLGVERFFFGKTRRHSEQFLALMKQAELFVGVDAGPLHLADALGVPAIGLFGPTAPETILDRDSGVVPWRLPAMQGWFCDVRVCTDPKCLRRLFERGGFDEAAVRLAGQVPKLEQQTCRAVEGGA
jgi:ADP-heptose:LPS heptosyltransferase